MWPDRLITSDRAAHASEVLLLASSAATGRCMRPGRCLGGKPVAVWVESTVPSRVILQVIVAPVLPFEAMRL